MVVRLTHEQWFEILEKQNRAWMASLLPDVQGVIAEPWRIDADMLDSRCYLYYREPSGPNDTLLFVVVKCLPRRFAGRRGQLLYGLAGRLGRRNWGEAWVRSAYFVKHPKSRGSRVWP